MQNLSYENLFDLHLNELVSETDLHMKGLTLGLVLKQRQISCMLTSPGGGGLPYKNDGGACRTF